MNLDEALEIARRELRNGMEAARDEGDDRAEEECMRALAQLGRLPEHLGQLAKKSEVDDLLERLERIVADAEKHRAL